MPPQKRAQCTSRLINCTNNQIEPLMCLRCNPLWYLFCRYSRNNLVSLLPLREVIYCKKAYVSPAWQSLARWLSSMIWKEVRTPLYTTSPWSSHAPGHGCTSLAPFIHRSQSCILVYTYTYVRQETLSNFALHLTLKTVNSLPRGAWLIHALDFQLTFSSCPCISRFWFFPQKPLCSQGPDSLLDKPFLRSCFHPENAHCLSMFWLPHRGVRNFRELTPSSKIPTSLKSSFISKTPLTFF